jgi:hypothetical protein
VRGAYANAAANVERAVEQRVRAQLGVRGLDGVSSYDLQRGRVQRLDASVRPVSEGQTEERLQTLVGSWESFQNSLLERREP